MRVSNVWLHTALAVLLLCVPTPASAQSEETQIMMDTADSTSGDYLRKVLLDIENDPAAGLKKLVRFLRSGDTRMVMVKPSPEFKGKQRQFHAAQGIPGLLRQLDPSGANPEVRMRAAEAVHLLALENPPLSQQIGLHAWIPGMFGLAELFAMVEAGCGAGAGAGEDVLRGAEEAAEAVWALSVTSVENLETVADKGMEALRAAVLTGGSARLRMWAAACLKRVAIDFYDTTDGSYASAARRFRNNDKARLALAQDTELMDALILMVRDRRVKEATPRAEWPTHAPVTAHDSVSIEAWAAAGALASIAGTEEAAEILLERGAGEALCALRASPDALERVEADAGLTALEYENCSHHRKGEL